MSTRIDIKDIKTPLIPQEIWVLEQYINPDYLANMVEAWERMIHVAEVAYDDYMRHIPSDYRHRELGEQVDIVWGNRILPNFRAGLSALQKSVAQVRVGDYDTQADGGSVRSAIRGSGDYWHGWMEEPALIARLGFNPLEEFYKQQEIARKYANNIEPTYDSGWHQGSLTGNLDENWQGWGLSFPQEWPSYRLNPIYQCATDEPVPKHGIYLPAAANSCAEFMPAYSWNPSAVNAKIGNGRNGMTYGREPTIWTLVERVADTGGGKVEVRIIPEAEEKRGDFSVTLCAYPGQPCPKAGLWRCPTSSPAREVRMNAGEAMPGPEVDPKTRNAVIWYFKGEFSI